MFLWPSHNYRVWRPHVSVGGSYVPVGATLSSGVAPCSRGAPNGSGGERHCHLRATSFFGRGTLSCGRATVALWEGHTVIWGGVIKCSTAHELFC